MKYVFLILITIFLSSCVKTQKNPDFTDIYPNNYNYSLRWKRFDNLKAYLKEDDYKTLDKIKKKYKDSTINSYKIILIKKIKDKYYKVILNREEVLLPSNTLKNNRYIQYWYFDKNNNVWKLEKEIKDTED